MLGRAPSPETLQPQLTDPVLVEMRWLRQDVRDLRLVLVLALVGLKVLDFAAPTVAQALGMGA